MRLAMLPLSSAGVAPALADARELADGLTTAPAGQDQLAKAEAKVRGLTALEAQAEKEFKRVRGLKAEGKATAADLVPPR